MTESARAASNFVSEWFGQRIYPVVRIDVNRLTGANSGRCPFLTEVLRASSACVKSANSSGVCTVSSVSNGSRQDWLVCPYRVISSDIVRRSCQLIFGLGEEVNPAPVTVLERPQALAAFISSVRRNGAGYLFFQNKLGGEISVVGTPKSPELSFDVTLVEITPDGADGFQVARYGILELQTMDYHGTYKHAVSNLRDGLRLHPDDFAESLRTNLAHWTGQGVEGPNIANVFKRTFYQVMLKFRLAGGGSAAAGTVLALPRSVWDSWQPFLGAPELEDEGPDLKRLRVAADTAEEPLLNSYICVFDLDASDPGAISPLKIEHFIRVSPERLTHHAFTEVPLTILNALQSQESVLSRVKARLAEWWPTMTSPPAAKQPRGKKRGAN